MIPGKMIFREALTSDIMQIQRVRNSVHENRLSNPALVTDDDCRRFLSVEGKGWVCEADGRVVGFSIVDVLRKNIWALFVHPDYERKGIGKQLQFLMLTWYFQNYGEPVWLGTAPDTRAEKFYTYSGWRRKGMRDNGEVKFEMTKEEWLALQPNR